MHSINNNNDPQKRLQKAFQTIERKDFVLPQHRPLAHCDQPLPIGYGQTISQPSTVFFMLNLLSVEQGHHVLDVGTGSGWTTGLLSYLVGSTGSVVGVERIGELVDFGRKNLSKYHFTQSKIIPTSRELGYPKEAPYDRILVSAAGNELAETLVDQLKIGGKMVIPIQSSIWLVTKTLHDYQIKKTEGFAFVPLIT